MTEDDKKQTEMIDDIKTYLRMKDYYQILGVEKDADDTKIKNAYRRLAIRFHPDKNKLEGAKQVFHKISNAYTTLIDKQSRESYDRYGPNEQILQRESARRQQHYKQANGEDVDEFEYIFRQFFGGPMAQGNTYYYQFGGRPQNNQQQGQRGGLNMLHLFIIMSVALSVLPRLFESAPYFSFKVSNEYPTPRQTSVFKARYFSGSEFLKVVQGKPQKLLEIEQQIDSEYYKMLYHQCESQNQLRRRYQQAAYNSYYDEKKAQYLLKAKQVDLQSCQRLRYIQENHYQYVASIV